jgi:hypothetical protein
VEERKPVKWIVWGPWRLLLYLRKLLHRAEELVFRRTWVQGCQTASLLKKAKNFKWQDFYMKIHDANICKEFILKHCCKPTGQVYEPRKTWGPAATGSPI